MTLGFVQQLMRESITRILMLTSPVLGASLAVSMLLALLMAVMSLHEATITLFPKLLVIFITLVLLAPWMFSSMGEWTRQLFLRIPDFAK